MDFRDLSLYPASHDQLVECLRRFHGVWGRGVPLDAFVNNTLALEAKEQGENGKFIMWVLAPRNDPTTIDFCASCGTYRRDVVMSTQAESIVKTAYGIQSVFTPERHRRKGYARHMMRLLHYILADPAVLSAFPEEQWGPAPHVPEGFGNGLFSVLYSDIGPDFYAQCPPSLESSAINPQAWQVKDPVSTIWQVEDLPKVEESEFEWLDDQTFTKVFDRDASLIEAEISTKGDETWVSFLPNKGLGAYQFHRTIAHDPENRTTGAILPLSTSLDYVTWVVDHGRDPPSTLLITRIRATAHSFSTLFGACRLFCEKRGVKQVEVWNLEGHLELEIERGVTEAREEHLPGMAWYGPPGRVRWLHNEKFAWC